LRIVILVEVGSLDVSWIFQRMDLLSVVDILLVALIFYGLLFLVRDTQAVPLLRGVLILVVLSVLITSIFPLRAFSWLVRNAVPALLVAIPVIFQPELRRALERLGRTGTLLALTSSREAMIERVLDQVCLACEHLSERRHGALIVLERETGLQEYVDTGVKINSEVSAEILETIFYPKTALHDGAVIIRQDQVAAAACVLPLAGGHIANRQLGLRHRAAIGVTEQSDAVTVVVSEETGILSMAHNGRIIRRLDIKRLRTLLAAVYQPQLVYLGPRWLRRLGRGRRRFPAYSRSSEQKSQ
jgi:diadenylate cyclase